MASSAVAFGGGGCSTVCAALREAALDKVPNVQVGIPLEGAASPVEAFRVSAGGGGIAGGLSPARRAKLCSRASTGTLGGTAVTGCGTLDVVDESAVPSLITTAWNVITGVDESAVPAWSVITAPGTVWLLHQRIIWPQWPPLHQPPLGLRPRIRLISPPPRSHQQPPVRLQGLEAKGYGRWRR